MRGVQIGRGPKWLAARGGEYHRVAFGNGDGVWHKTRFGQVDLMRRAVSTIAIEIRRARREKQYDRAHHADRQQGLPPLPCLRNNYGRNHGDVIPPPVRIVPDAPILF